MPEVCRAVPFSYGTSFRSIFLHYVEGHSSARLTNLLRRLRNIVEVIVKEQEAIPALSISILKGCCHRVEMLDLSMENSVLTQQQLYLLEAVLEADEVLPELKCLKFHCTFMDDGLPRLARALASGSAPQLQYFLFNDTDCHEDDLIAIDMVEARARILGCHRLDILCRNSAIWLDRASVKLKFDSCMPYCRPLRSSRNSHFEPCFLEKQAPYLLNFSVRIENDGTLFSVEVLVAAPALVKIELTSISRDHPVLIGPALQAISGALNRDCLRKLKEFEIYDCTLVGEDYTDFLNALERSGCAERLSLLAFFVWGIGLEEGHALADLFGRCVFSALKSLFLDRNPMQDAGVVALVEGLVKPTRTFLEVLNLRDVRMGDEGIIALASLVEKGRLEWNSCYA